MAEEFSGQYQGDIIISPQQLAEYEGRAGRTGLRNSTFRWRDGIVPYEVIEAHFSKKFFEIFVTARF